MQQFKIFTLYTPEVHPHTDAAILDPRKLFMQSPLHMETQRVILHVDVDTFFLATHVCIAWLQPWTSLASHCAACSAAALMCSD